MKVLIKGAGDLATGIAIRLKKCGFSIVMTDISVPTTVRRTVAFSRAVYENEVTIEGITGRLVQSVEEAEEVVQNGDIAVIVDEKAAILYEWNPMVMIDAILAKKNLGTTIHDAPLVIGVGPGFTAKKDCHLVIETKRGHYMGKVITSGSAIANTGIPGNIGGYTTERIIRATADGLMKPVAAIGDQVELGQLVAYTGDKPVYANMPGIVRGMLQENVKVFEGMKSGDIDNRCEIDHCFTVSDKARSIGGGVLEGILSYISIVK